jgi:hypothetical protein
MSIPLNRVLVIALTINRIALFFAAAETAPKPQDQCRFIGIRDLGQFTTESGANSNQTVLHSPVIKAPMAWNELVVSWNAVAPADAWLEIEARGDYPGRQTKFYKLGLWSDVSSSRPRQTFGRQRDADGAVKTDTLVLIQPGADLELRITLGGTAQALAPRVKFLGISFFDSHAAPEPLPANREAWGKIIKTPERSQLTYPQQQGWCSPTSLSMVLARWAEVLHRSELDIDVPEVAAGVFDRHFDGTGNWPFNTAFAGKFPGMRAYATRLTDLAEVEEWIAAGFPVIMSAPWHLLSPGRRDTGNGHLVVCIGFTEDGDVVINDPATNLKKGQQVRHIYKRQDVINAWKSSHNTVYLVYPESAQIPPDRFGHWEERREERR